MAGVTLLLVQRPLHAPGLWWHLSRGREVFAGTLCPSRDLLSLDVAGEADWLGGVLFYFTWSWGGIHALAAVPLLAAAAVIFSTRRRFSSTGGFSLIVFCPLLLWTIRDGLQPVPAFFDFLGLFTLWHVLQRDMSPRSRLLAVGVILAAWANLGPRPIWGLLLVVFFSPQGAGTFLKCLAAAVLGGLLTPRGLFTWRDSAVLFSPSAFERLGTFREAHWSGSFQGEMWSVSEIAFLLLWCGWVW
jgi:hypothetical protein